MIPIVEPMSTLRERHDRVNNAHNELWSIETYFDGIPGWLCIERTAENKTAADIDACVRRVWTSVSLVIEPPGGQASRNDCRALPCVISAG
jgi:hypothetical protein